MTTAAHYDVVVVGSGFGGSVVAYRLAQAGKRVVLLDRGRAYPPGAFPRNPYRMKSNFWHPSEGCYVLHDLWTSPNVAGVIASGLGGGSLIFANVLLRKDERTFVREPANGDGYENWPVTRADLDPHYDRVETILAPQRYPIDVPPYSKTHRAQALRSAADALQVHWFPPKLAVTFAVANDAPRPGEPIMESIRNLHDRPRETRRLCAECCLDCNYGSKSSLDFNYLTLARNAGAEIHPLSEVRGLHPRTDPEAGYVVRFVRHDLSHAGQKTASHDTTMLPLHSVTADRVVLAAGTYGSTFLLLESQAALPGLSACLGAKFCIKGDILAVGRKSSRRTPSGRTQRIIEADVGTAITGAIRIPGAADGGDDSPLYIEDMGFPTFMSWLLQAADLPNTTDAIRRLVPRLIAWHIGLLNQPDAVNGDLATLFGSTELSTGLLRLVGVGRDVPNGRLTLRDGRVHVSWSEDRSQQYFTRARDMARSVVHAVGDKYLDTPTRVQFVTA